MMLVAHGFLTPVDITMLNFAALLPNDCSSAKPRYARSALSDA